MKSQTSRKPKILVVDDEPDNLDLLYRTFYRDYKVLRADSGPAALELLDSEGDVAVIISDQRMPIMSGTEFLALTAARYPDIIRIILTGYTDVEDLVDAINSGKVFKYVTKPWDAEELKEVVRQALDTHNVVKLRTEELYRTLRRESLLNTVINTIRNAQYGGQGESPLRQILQTIVETVGQMLEADICILRPFQDDRMADDVVVYQKSQVGDKGPWSPSLQSNGLGAVQRSPINSDNHPLSSDLPEFLAQTVWETRDVEVINDVETSELFQGAYNSTQESSIANFGATSAIGTSPLPKVIAYQQANIRSTLVVPLISQQELMAVLALHQRGTPRFWQDDEIQLVVMVADQAALAVSQARAYEQVHALAQREALVNTITTAIRSSLDPQDIFAAIVKQLGQALQVDACALSLWTEEDEFVQCVGLYNRETLSSISGQKLEEQLQTDTVGGGKAGNLAVDRAPVGNLSADNSSLPQSITPISANPVLQELLKTQQPVVINDLDRSSTNHEFDLLVREPARALLVVPLISDGKIIGSITLRQTHKDRKWQSSEIELGQVVAAQAAIAVQQSRLYQKTREQAERLMELDRQKTEFFQNVSHEFRTPLTLMIGPLESAVSQQKDFPYDQAQIALRNSRRLLRLVNQLLDLQRLDAGRMQASYHPCDLVEFVSQIVEAFRPYCEKKGIRVNTQLISCPLVYLDLEKFDKVLYNLLSNAMKFTPANGSITVKLEPAGDRVQIQVSDTGIGIRSEQIPHLFERFRQAEGSVNRSYEGTGLGLSLVKELVELHKGQITVDSVYGSGTTFSIWLLTGTAHLPAEQVLDAPAQMQKARSTVELADLEVEVEANRDPSSDTFEIELDPEVDAVVEQNGLAANSENPILVVDDNPDLRGYVSRILREAGYPVFTARNGQEGFSVVKERRPHLIVTDLMMPIVSGLDLIRMMRADAELKGTPIILLTAKADEASRIEGTEKGADAYLSKPFNDRELLAEVRNLLALKATERRVVQLNTYLTESVLKRFLPPSMVKQCATGELSLDLRPEPRLITILFSDIVGFTQLSNTLRSRRVAQLLNEYLESMTMAVFENGGTVDKFMGDAVLALFGAPEELTPNEQVRRALAAARQMYRSLDKLNQRWQEQGIVGNDGPPPVQFRCGIHQGTAVVGMFGSSERSDYTAIGPSVNIASRLQEAAAPNSILISAAVADYLDEDEIIKCKPLQLKGIDETVLTFAVSIDKRVSS